MLISIIVGIIVLTLVASLAFIMAQYKRCPSNQLLVIYGKTGTDKSAKCVHGGGTFIIPLMQDYEYLPLEPMSVPVDLKSALSKENIRVNIPSTFTVAISTKEDLMLNAAERLLGFSKGQICEQVSDIVIGQLRSVVASLTIEEINQDRDKFLELINKTVDSELNKIGVSIINVNIIDITDESGYIEAIGKKASSEAINRAQIDVAKQEQLGASGVAEANKTKMVCVADRKSETEVGMADAHKKMSIGVAEAEKDTALAVAEQQAQQADGENKAKVRIAKAQQEGKVAQANSEKAVADAEKQSSIAVLRAHEVVRQEIEKEKIKVNAEANAIQVELGAKAEANAVLLRATAEADGIKKKLDAQAEGLKALVDACGGDAALANGYLMLDKIPEITAIQVEALKNIKIDKLVVWDSGNGADGKGGVISNLSKDMISSIPQLHELAASAGLELPSMFGKVGSDKLTTDKK